MRLSLSLCVCVCRVFAFLNVLENDLLKISLARHRGKTTSKLIKNLLPSLKNVTPVARRSIRPRGKVRTLREDESAAAEEGEEAEEDGERTLPGAFDIERYFG